MPPMIRSFSIEVTENHSTGNGIGNLHTLSMDIRSSTSSGSRYYNLWFNDISPLTNLTVKVQDSNLSESDSGVAVAFDMQPTGATTNAAIDPAEVHSAAPDGTASLAA
jgi:hypothetical protein